MYDDHACLLTDVCVSAYIKTYIHKCCMHKA